MPHLVNLVMRNRRLLAHRERIGSAADGRVLEVGIGSGLNLPFYSAGVREVIGLDPAPRLIAMARTAAARSSLRVTLVEGSAETIPLDDASIDSIVLTWTLCSIAQAGRALSEMRRVLRPGGQLLFVEHGSAPEPGVRRWQDRLTPAWKRISGGCHLNRPVPTLIKTHGFAMAQVAAGYMPGPKPMSFLYEGRATRA